MWGVWDFPLLLSHIPAFHLPLAGRDAEVPWNQLPSGRSALAELQVLPLLQASQGPGLPPGGMMARGSAPRPCCPGPRPAKARGQHSEWAETTLSVAALMAVRGASESSAGRRPFPIGVSHPGCLLFQHPLSRWKSFSLAHALSAK